MKFLDKNNLGKTLDLLNEVFASGLLPTKAQKFEAAEWIAGRQGLPGSYANMFAPTENDFKNGIHVFTGENVRSRAATAHILGEEAMRSLILLDVDTPKINKSITLAKQGFLKRLGPKSGFYCCGICTCSLWRNLAAGGLDNSEKRFVAGMKEIKSLRKGDCTWKRFPFYYTILALTEIPPELSRPELKYAAPKCEKLLSRMNDKDNHTRRRRIVLEKAISIA